MASEGMGPSGMNSFNHYAYGCVCEWIWETAAGIAADPMAPGFRHIVMKPVPDKRLGSLDASFQSAAGQGIQGLRSRDVYGCKIGREIVYLPD